MEGKKFNFVIRFEEWVIETILKAKTVHAGFRTLTHLVTDVSLYESLVISVWLAEERTGNLGR
jgi:hypothetical protein